MQAGPSCVISVIIAPAFTAGVHGRGRAYGSSHPPEGHVLASPLLSVRLDAEYLENAALCCVSLFRFSHHFHSVARCRLTAFIACFLSAFRLPCCCTPSFSFCFVFLRLCSTNVISERHGTWMSHPRMLHEGASSTSSDSRRISLDRSCTGGMDRGRSRCSSSRLSIGIPLDSSLIRARRRSRFSCASLNSSSRGV